MLLVVKRIVFKELGFVALLAVAVLAVASLTHPATEEDLVLVAIPVMAVAFLWRSRKGWA